MAAAHQDKLNPPAARARGQISRTAKQYKGQRGYKVHPTYGGRYRYSAPGSEPARAAPAADLPETY